MNFKKKMAVNLAMIPKFSRIIWEVSFKFAVMKIVLCSNAFTITSYFLDVRYDLPKRMQLW